MRQLTDQPRQYAEHYARLMNGMPNRNDRFHHCICDTRCWDKQKSRTLGLTSSWGR